MSRWNVNGMGRRGLDSSGSGKRQVASCCVDGGRPSGSKKFGEFLESLTNYQLLTTSSASRGWLLVCLFGWLFGLLQQKWGRECVHGYKRQSSTGIYGAFSRVTQWPDTQLPAT
jgi:hypothetical protein